MSRFVAVILQLAAILLFVAGGVYLLAEQAMPASARVPLVVGGLLSVFLLLGFAELINLLADIRTAVERTADAIDRRTKARGSTD